MPQPRSSKNTFWYASCSCPRRLCKAWLLNPARLFFLFMRVVLQAQLDLRIEHSNIQRFRENFRHDSCVVFPAVFDGLCTSSCLVETWEEGEGLRDFFLRIDRANPSSPQSKQRDVLDLLAEKSVAPSPLRTSLPETLSLHPPQQEMRTSRLLDLMSAEEILELSQQLGIVGANAFLKMLVRDNFVHVRQQQHCKFSSEAVL
jgi:hypothetical protein